MRERVSVIYGREPILLVAPHGADDINTDIIVEEAAKTIGCNAVINRGFDRADNVDVDADQANCNRVDHIIQPVVYDEFLKPILKIKNKIQKGLFGNNLPGMWGMSTSKDKKALIFYVHGAGDAVHKLANEDVDVIIGYGRGNKKDSLTCKQWRKNLFVDLWRNYTSDGEVYEGSGGGKYAGRNSNNLNQYFRKHQMDRWVDCMQLEFPYCTRKTASRATLTAMMLNTVLTEFLKYDSYENEPKSKFI